ncbi:O-methyltransferase [Oleiagrimonas soli]|uniref:Methyltransferase n=1 Tax=Oleiagrimonas soli TaxID=1543381 RepID=A0A099D052_9GAMM|nr:O-methyltransferase [Oleiagrimonas soli]KGI78640.1 methyltransferase [Oleiagrimonas soli]MBB6184058.1 putative O-methyltransferase YrrM [Oleiagrimonas soli]
MNEPNWSAVDAYLADRTHATDAMLDAVLRTNEEAGLPCIDVSPLQGRFLQLVTRMCGARKVLEIGTLGGYSTLCIARGLPDDGHVTTLEFDPRHAEVARANLQSAGFAERVDVRVGAALDTLPALEREGRGPFDLIFIDAYKTHNADYLQWALRLSRPGTVVILDNVVRQGHVLDADSDSPSVRGTRRALDLIAAEPRLTATALQTVGSKDWDGFAMAIVD